MTNQSTNQPIKPIKTAAALSTPERVAGLVVLDIAPVAYSITDGTNWQDTHKVYIHMYMCLYLNI